MVSYGHVGLSGAAYIVLMLAVSVFIGSQMKHHRKRSGKAESAVGFGIAVGLALGAGIGAAMGNLGLGIGVGVAIGAAIETSIQVRKKKD